MDGLKNYRRLLLEFYMMYTNKSFKYSQFSVFSKFNILKFFNKFAIESDTAVA